MDDNQQNKIYVTEDIYLKTATAHYANITLLIQIVFCSVNLWHGQTNASQIRLTF
ncbi:hypothetical protein [Gilliamella sp. ESL0443]|uniref:hypothetical protein n=1 Tax=Gilliamella sp. ESL0443 TaxID=2704655 RepID=UPI001C69817D|nr:hypothetical protein [Gilliamella sp. ESL0443]QYN41418.1 hypothetical protein GYM76_01070 [Gilliamella sp. ESL0443]